ncbi:hypothetical protein RP20_CCG003591 [Aedes albopictus]|nr:hypothetical protein RP20_CCG003591 [Aedes albopictus]
MSDDYELEEQRLLRRKKKSSEAGNLQQLAETCRKLGELYSSRGEHLKALNEYKLVAKAFNRLQMQMEVGRANRMIGEMYMLLGESEKALQYEKLYLDIARTEKDKVELQRAYATIGRNYLLKGQSCDETEVAKEALCEAEKAFVKGLKLCRDLKEVGRLEQSDMEARAILNLGVTKEHQGDLEEALEYMQKATKIAQNNDIQDVEHLCLMTTAQLYNGKLNNPTKALKVLSEALEVASRLSNKIAKMCETLTVKADAMIKIGDFQSAKQALKKAYHMKTPVAADAESIERNLKVLVAICRVEDELITTGSDEYGKKKILYEKMGDGSCKLLNFEKAIDYYLKMLECAELNGETGRQLVPTYVSLYQTYKDNKQYEEALKYMWKEYELIKDEPKEAYNTLLSISEIFEEQKRNCFEIEDIYRRVRHEAQKLQSLSLQRAPMKRCVAMLKKNCMDLMAENLEKEAADLGIDLNLADDANGPEESDDEPDEPENAEPELNTPDIGDDVDLEELTESEDDNSTKPLEKQPESRASRKRGVSFQIKRNNKGETQLHQACINGNVTLVQKLLEQGHPVNLRDHAGWLPLHEACNKGDKEIVEMLLDKGGQINDKGGTSCDGITPLYDACSNGNLEVVELLLDRGANCTLRTDSGDTTLNVLETWFKSVHKKIPPERKTFYDVIRDRIINCFDKAGIKPTEGGTIPDSIQAESSSQGTTRSTRRRGARLGRPDSDAESTAPTTRSSGYGSVKAGHVTPSRKRPAEIQSDDSCLSSDEDNNSSALKDCFREKSSRLSAGVDDYRSAMQVLRKGNLVRAQIVSPLKDPNPGPSKRSAFLRNDEIGDDWLVDDLGPNKKKQKIYSDNDFYEMAPLKSPLRRDSTPKKAYPISDHTITSTAIDPDSDDDFDRLGSPSRHASSEYSGQDAHQLLMNASNRSFSRRPSTQSSRASRRLSNDSYGDRNQASLLEAGFTVSSSRSISPPPLSPPRTPVKNNDDDGQGSPLVESTQQVEQQRTPVKVVPTNVVRVLIEGEPFDFTFEPDQMMQTSVGWLVHEVTKRYGVKHGKRPLLKLLRWDDGPIEDSDPLSTLINETNIIVNTYLTGFEEMKAHEFYDDYCHESGIDTVSDLRQALEDLNMQTNFSLSKDFFIENTRQCDILIKALATRERLQKLDLSWNQLSDSDMDVLSQKLSNFRNLEMLNLSMNYITFKGICSLSSVVNAEELLLTELDLSQNPLLDQSVPELAVVCQRLKHLTILRVASTAITNLILAESPLDISKLNVFDASENDLNQKSLEFLLNKSNTSIVTELNLRSLGSIPDFKPTFITAIQNNHFGMLLKLNLCNCGLTDCDLTTIVLALSRSAIGLQWLDLSHNSKLTIKSFIEILKILTRRPLQLSFRQNPYILKDFDAEETIRAIEYDGNKSYPYDMEFLLPLGTVDDQLEDLRRQLNVFWDKLWHNHGTIQIIDRNVRLSAIPSL